MKTQEELNALKKEAAVLKEKLAALSDEELAQVAGGRRTDDPDQAAAHGYICIAYGSIEESTTLPADVKTELTADVKYVFDGTLPWVYANPTDLIPRVNGIITKLEPYRNQEHFGWVQGKLKLAVEHLKNLKD